MQSAAETLQQAVLTGRIRDALRTLGYAVPAGSGLGTPQVLAALGPAILTFTKKKGPAFAARVERAKNPMDRALLFAEAAEEEAKRVNPTPSAMKALSALAAGFVAYRAMKQRAGGHMENLTLSDLVTLFRAHAHR